MTLPGYSGAVLVCTGRYNPIAGHRTGRKSTQFMADNRDMEVWLAPVEGARVLRAGAHLRAHDDRHDGDRRDQADGVKAASGHAATSTASATAAAAGN